MNRLKGRMLAVVLATATLLSSVTPAGALAAEPAEADTSAEAFTAASEIEPAETEEGDMKEEGEMTAEGSGADEAGEAAAEENGEESEPAENMEEGQEENEDEVGKAEGEGSGEAEAPEAGSGEGATEEAPSRPADNAEEGQDAKGETAAPAAEEEKEPADGEEEIAMGRFALRFDSEGGIVKVIVSTDEGANEDDPSYELEKSGGSVRVKERSGNAYDASMAEGYALDIEAEAGARITVIADAAEGFHVSEYSVTADAGGEEGTGFDGGEGRFSHTASVPGDGRKVFSVGFEQDEVKAENGTVTVKVGSSGGTVTVTVGDEVYTIVKPGKGDAVVTDRSGREIASADGNFDLAIEDEVGKTVTVRAVADKGSQVTAFTVAGTDGNAEASSFNAEEAPAEFEQQVVIADGRKAVNVSFGDMPEFNAEKKAGKYIVKIHADEGVLPRWARVSVKEMKEADAKPYAEKAEEMADAGVAVAVFDITFTDFWGREIQPNGMVEVTFENAVEENAAMSVYHAPEGDAAKMEEVKAEEKDDAVSFKMDSFSPVVLLAAAPEPDWTQGGKGSIIDVSDKCTANLVLVDNAWFNYGTHGRNYSDNENSRTVRYGVDVNGEIQADGMASCVNPDLDGVDDLADRTADKVYEVTAPLLVKLMYYGNNGPGSSVVEEIYKASHNGTSEVGGQEIITHVAISEVFARMWPGYSKTGVGDGFVNTTSTLKNDVYAFINKCNSLSVPSNYHAYYAKYNNQKVQDFIYGSSWTPEEPGALVIRKIPDDESRTVREQIMANSNYNMAGAVYCVYRSTADAAADRNRVVDVETKKSTIPIKADGTSDPYTVNAGKYYVKEVKAPTKGGYQISGTATPVTVASGSTSDPIVVSVSEPFKYVFLRIVKQAPAGMKNPPSLAGAVFNVYSDMKCEESSRVGTLTTDASGKTEQLKEDTKGHKLLIQNYYVKEVKAPEGYSAITTRLTIDKASDTLSKDVRYELIDRTLVEPVPKKGLSVLKVSANPEVTDDNDCYPSFEGAEFGIFTNESCTGEPFRTIVTDADGIAQSATDLPIAEYWVKETKAPDGYDVVDEVFHVTEEELIKNPSYEIKVEDPPKMDPAQIKIVKRSADGKEGDLSEAEFTFSYYKGFLSEDEIVSTSPERSWTIKTKKFDDEYSARFNTCVDDGTFVRGDEFYLDSKGNPAFPLGTVTIEETKAPEGFLNDPDFGNGAKMLVGHVVLNDDGDAVFTVISGMDPVENTVTVDETPEPEPEVGTTLVNKADGTHVVPADTDVELVDTVSYKKVIPGKTYTVTGTLMDKSTKKALQYNGKDVTATATFKAEKEEGTADVTFTFNTEDLGGKSLVAFEQLSCNGKVVASHEDWDDEGQTVTVKPNVLITTTLVNAEDGTHLVPAAADVELKDTVSYEGVVPGETYEVTGTIMDKSTGKALQYNGKDVIATSTFKPDRENGTVEVAFRFNTKGLNGKELVAFEVLRCGGEVVATHEDINDKGQTVYVPTIETDAYDDATGEQNIPAAKNEVFIDKVTCTTLVPGKTYEISGEVKIKPDDGSTDFDAAETVPSEIVGAEADWGTISYDKDKVTFVPAAVTGAEDEVVSGVIYISFKVDSSDMAGESLVVSETERNNGKIIAVHRDINDERQTPKIPKIGTSLVNKEDGTQVVPADTEVTLVDTVSYENVLPGKSYTVSGALMDTSTKGVLQYNGKNVTAETTFVPDKAKGTVEVTFTFNSKGMDSKTLVAFEELTLHGDDGDEIVASHEVWTDKGQTVTIPGIETDAYDDVTGKQNIPAAKDEIFIDKVTCTTLVPGETYEISGEVKIKPDDSSIGFDAAETVPSEIVGAKADWGTISYDKDKVTFVPAAVTGAEDEVVSGVIYISFKVDSSDMAGESLVVGETERYNGKVVAVHRDINDDRQTPKVPKIGTTLVEKESKGHLVLAGKDVELVDTVSYENVIPGETYLVTGRLMDKATKKAFTVGGKEVTAAATFKAENTEGTVDVTFTFNTKGLEGKTLVAYEQLLLDSVVVAKHEDIDDKGQTVVIPKIGTTLVDGESGEHLVLADADVTLKDTVAYENLIADETYDVTGTLMDKSTGKALQYDGKDVTATATFKAEKENGTVDVTFTFNTKGLEGKTLVAFEELSFEGYVVAEHNDLDDMDQTVVIPGIETDLYDGETEEKNTLAAEDRILVDKVSYKGLLPGKTYEVSGEVKIKPDDGNDDFDGAETVPSEIVGARSDNENISFDKEKVTFTPAGNDGETVSGSLYISFKVDASELAGEELVVGETATYNGLKIAVHRDISDKRQTDYVPDGETMAVDTATGIKNTLATENRVFKDTFRYEKLLPGKTYRFTGKVMADAGTDDEGHDLLEEIPSVMTDADGKPVDNGYIEFVPEEAYGTIDLYFAIDATTLENRDVTVFERVSLNGKPVIIHEVLDGTQTIYVPEGRTTAVDSETQDQVSMPDEEAGIIDTLNYKNLIPGTEYTVKGRVMRKTTGDEIVSTLTEASYAEGSSGSVSVAESVVTFTPEQEDGALKLTFVFSASELAGEDVVAFERVYHNGSEVIVHENIEDEAQTVHFPDGHTNASDPDTNDRMMKAEQNVKIRDEFVYENLIPGKQYVITGKAMLKPLEGEEPQEITAVMVDADGNEITEYVFTPESKDGSEYVYFVIDASELAGRSVVMYETMEYINPELEIRTEIVKHEDIDDEDETIHFPDGGTKATDSETLDHIARPDEKAKVIDEVTYRNLIPGKMYTVKGILMDKDTKEPVIFDGSEVTAEMQFVPEEADGSIFMEFEFNASALAGTTSAVFETVYSEGKEVFVHADIDDEEQTIHFPDGGTTALDSETGSHTAYADEDITIIDEVTYRNLVPGKEYTVTGTLKDKETGKSLKEGGKEVTSEKTFTAETADGSIFIEFTFNGLRLAGRSIVAFETMTYEGVPVFVHADLDDRDQTVDFPEVHTTATDKKDGDHEIDYKGTVTVKDDVEYTNLTPGMKYRVVGTLMNKKTGKAAKAGGREITGEAEFTAKEKNGTVQVEFTFDSSKIEEGSYVVFETLYEIDAKTGEEHIVGAHRDINDDAQTVRRPKPPTPHGVRTGDDSNVAVWAVALTAAIAGLAGAVIYGRKRFGK